MALAICRWSSSSPALPVRHVSTPSIVDSGLWRHRPGQQPFIPSKNLCIHLLQFTHSNYLNRVLFFCRWFCVLTRPLSFTHSLKKIPLWFCVCLAGRHVSTLQLSRFRSVMKTQFRGRQRIHSLKKSADLTSPPVLLTAITWIVLF